MNQSNSNTESRNPNTRFSRLLFHLAIITTGVVATLSYSSLQTDTYLDKSQDGISADTNQESPTININQPERENNSEAIAYPEFAKEGWQTDGFFDESYDGITGAVEKKDHDITADRSYWRREPAMRPDFSKKLQNDNKKPLEHIIKHLGPAPDHIFPVNSFPGFLRVPTQIYKGYCFEDLNGDHCLDEQDVKIVRHMLMGFNRYDTPLWKADVNFDNTVDNVDLQLYMDAVESQPKKN